MQGREIPFFTIEGQYYGGDQYWNTQWMMKNAGCSTATATEISIWLAKRGIAPALCPFDPQHVSRAAFLSLFSQIYPYVHPTVGGLTNIDRYGRMFQEYGASCGVNLAAAVLSGNAQASQAAAFIRSSIDADLPLAYLMLRHRDPRFDDFEWHWFTVTGYEEASAGLELIAATYGEKYRFALHDAWNTGFERKGGLVRVSPEGGSDAA